MNRTMFYFECDTFNGKFVYGIDADSKTADGSIFAKKDLKKLLLCGETIKAQLSRRPRGVEFEKVTNVSWAIRGRATKK